MQKVLGVLVCSLLIISLTGCATLRQLTQRSTQLDLMATSAYLPPYSGPKARITIADFEVKTAKATGEISSSLREMLIAAFINSNRFSVVPRQELSTPDVIGADLIITTAVTEFEPQVSGGKAGVGGGGGVGSGVLGSLLGAALNKAHLALDIRIVKVSTSEIISTTSIQGQASDTSGAIMTDFLGNRRLGSGLSVYVDTPMEKAIR
ncbi:MAG: hypothetical protein KKE91_04970, partial [Candidatus Omnitrophica bacterium]|nr:hypothetical protein [Candidatus Omnitrophota bacterium]